MALGLVTAAVVVSAPAAATHVPDPVALAAASPPPAPTAVTALPRDRAIELRWVAPDSHVPITAYRAYALGHARGCTTDGATSCVLAGVPNGVAHSFVVEAVTAAGTGVESSPSAPVVAGRPPGPPTGVAARLQGDAARVGWRAPADTGDLPGIEYRVSSRLGLGCVAAAPALACTVPNLAAGVVHRFRVTASNSMGESVPSAPADGLTPGLATPSRPVEVKAALDTRSGGIVVTWGRPVTAGMAPISSFTAHAGSHGSCTVPADRTGCVIPSSRRAKSPSRHRRESVQPASEAPDGSLRVVVAATNEFGAGADSAETPLSHGPAEIFPGQGTTRSPGTQDTSGPVGSGLSAEGQWDAPPSSAHGESYAVLVRPSGLASSGLPVADAPASQASSAQAPAAPALTSVSPAPHRRRGLVVRWAVPRGAHRTRVRVTLSPGDASCVAPIRRGFCLVGGLDPGQGYSAIARGVVGARSSAESVPTQLRLVSGT